MANEIFKEIKTRIALKYNTYEYWTEKEGKDYAPLKGEVCFCAIQSKDQGAQTAPTVLFKVGIDGETKFSALKWASALAADVYDWAKTAGLFVNTTGGGNALTSAEWDSTLNNGKGGLKFTKGATFATKEELEELRKGLEADTNTRYQFSIPTTGNDAGKLLVEKKEIGESTWTRVDAYDFVTPGELTETLKGYYTKGEADGKFVTGLAEGTTDGTIKAVVNGVSGTDVKVHGLKSAAYVTVESLNATAKGYADGKDGAIAEAKKAGTDAANALDAYSKLHEGDYNNNTIDSKVAAVLGESTDGVAANTVYGAKAAAAAAQNDATIAKTKIETFLGTVTPDGSQDIIDTLAEINSYVGEHGEEFAALSGRVTAVENNYAKTADLGDLAGKDKIVEGDIDGTIGVGKINGLGALATKDNITHDLVTDFDTAVKAVKVDNAVDAEKLGGQLPAYYATKESVDAIPGAIDSKISAYDTGKNFGDIITHNDAEYQKYNATLKHIADNYTFNDIGKLNESFGVGHYASGTAVTMGNGCLNLESDARQGGTSYNLDDIRRNIGVGDNAGHYTYSYPNHSGIIATEEWVEGKNYATEGWVEGKNYLTEITTTENHGLTVTNKNHIDIDTDVVFVLDCNW